MSSKKMNVTLSGYKDRDDGLDDLAAENINLDEVLRNSTLSRNDPIYDAKSNTYSPVKRFQPIIRLHDKKTIKESIPNTGKKTKGGIKELAQHSDDNELNDIEDDICFPDDFEVNMNKNGRSNLNVNMLSSVVYCDEISLSSSFSSSYDESSFSQDDHENKNKEINIDTPSYYSESDIESDYYQDIQLEADKDIKELLELRLRKAQIEAELEEKELEIQMKNKKQTMCNFLSSSRISEFSEYYDEEKGKFFEDFENINDFEKSITNAEDDLTLKRRKSIVISKTINSPQNSARFGLPLNLQEEYLNLVDNNDLFNTIRIAQVSKRSQPHLIDIRNYIDSNDAVSITSKHKKKTSRKQHLTSRKIALIRNLNFEQKDVIVETGYKGEKMVYDPTTYKWEGNEIDASRFDNVIPEKRNQMTNLARYSLGKCNEDHKASAKTVNDRRTKGVSPRVTTSKDDSDFEDLAREGLQVEGKMYFNHKKLCWISLDPAYFYEHIYNANDRHDLGPETGMVLEEEDPFKDIKDLPEDYFIETDEAADSLKKMAHDMEARDDKRNNRDMNHHSPRKQNNDAIFTLSDECLYNYQKEDERWKRKVVHWFSNHDRSFKDDLYEIRQITMINR